MFPIGDSPNPRGFAIVNIVLIVINVAVYVMLIPKMNEPANPQDPRFREYVQVLVDEGRVEKGQEQQLAQQLTEYDLFVFENGSRPDQINWLDMLKSMFLHGGFMHLFGNMLFLWIYGNNVEHRLGKIGYLVAYLATGYIASFGDVLLRPDSGVPGIGASGAISGVLGMYFIWFPQNRVRMLLLIPPMVRQMELSARMVLGFYIVVQNIFPALLGGGGGVAHGAHIGGFVGGVALALVMKFRDRAWPGREAEPAEQPKPGEVAAAHKAPDGLVGQVRDALATGDVHRASRLFFGSQGSAKELGFEPMDAITLGRELERSGEPRGALAAYEQALTLDPEPAAFAAAHLDAARVLARELSQPTLAFQHYGTAVRAVPEAARTPEARDVLREIQGRVGSVPRRFAGG